MTNIYEAELRNLLDRSKADGELLIAGVIAGLLGALNSPEYIQCSFAETIEDFARSAVIELQMNRNNEP